MPKAKSPSGGPLYRVHGLVDTYPDGTLIDPATHLPNANLDRLVALGALVREDDAEWDANQRDIYAEPMLAPGASRVDPFVAAGLLVPAPSLATGADIPPDPLTAATIDQKAATGDMSVAPTV